jgi:hypothetical protein
MHGAIPPLPQYVFMAWHLVKHRDIFTFTFYEDEITDLGHGLLGYDTMQCSAAVF